MEAADIQDIPGEYNPGLSSRTKDPGFTVTPCSLDKERGYISKIVNFKIT